MKSVLLGEQATRVIVGIRDGGLERDREAKHQIAQAGIEGLRLSVAECAALCRNAPIAVTEEVGGLLYLLARGRGGLIVEFGASLGISTIYLASALRDRGRGSLVTTEIDSEKASKLKANLSDAGVGEIVEIRIGDALETLRALPAPVDLLFLDGWNELYLSVLRLVGPRLAPEALVVADLSADDPDLKTYLEHVRDRQGVWRSVTLPLDAGVEISQRAGA
jgi:predicted O-methyltransferase YrrM